MMTDDTSAALERLRLYIEYDGGALPLADARAILAHIAALEARAERAEQVRAGYDRWISESIVMPEAEYQAMVAREAALRAVLKEVDDDVRHHLRSDRVDHAVLRKHVVQMVRQALAAAPAAPEKPSTLPAVPPAAWLEAMAQAITETLIEDDREVKVDSVGALRIARAAYAALARKMGDVDAE